MLTTGGSVQETIDAVRAAGGEPVGVGVVVDRTNGATDFGLPIALEVPSYPAEPALRRRALTVAQHRLEALVELPPRCALERVVRGEAGIFRLRPFQQLLDREDLNSRVLVVGEVIRRIETAESASWIIGSVGASGRIAPARAPYPP